MSTVPWEAQNRDLVMPQEPQCLRALAGGMSVQNEKHLALRHCRGKLRCPVLGQPVREAQAPYIEAGLGHPALLRGTEPRDIVSRNPRVRQFLGQRVDPRQQDHRGDCGTCRVMAAHSREMPTLLVLLGETGLPLTHYHLEDIRGLHVGLVRPENQSSIPIRARQVLHEITNNPGPFAGHSSYPFHRPAGRCLDAVGIAQRIDPRSGRGLDLTG